MCRLSQRISYFPSGNFVLFLDLIIGNCASESRSLQHFWQVRVLISEYEASISYKLSLSVLRNSLYSTHEKIRKVVSSGPLRDREKHCIVHMGGTSASHFIDAIILCLCTRLDLEMNPSRRRKIDLSSISTIQNIRDIICVPLSDQLPRPVRSRYQGDHPGICPL